MVSTTKKLSFSCPVAYILYPRPNVTLTSNLAPHFKIASFAYVFVGLYPVIFTGGGGGASI